MCVAQIRSFVLCHSWVSHFALLLQIVITTTSLTDDTITRACTEECSPISTNQGGLAGTIITCCDKDLCNAPQGRSSPMTSAPARTTPHPTTRPTTPAGTSKAHAFLPPTREKVIRCLRSPCVHICDFVAISRHTLCASVGRVEIWSSSSW